MHRPLCCYGRSALAALLFPVAEIAGVSDLGGVELAVLVLRGNGRAGLNGVGVRSLRVVSWGFGGRCFFGDRLCGSFRFGGSFRRSSFSLSGLFCLCFALGVDFGSLFCLFGVLLGLFGELDLFHIQDEAPGMIFWHARGWALWQVVEQYMRRVYQDNGYQEVKAPQLLDRSLWERSGHWAKYRENMFTTESENRYYALKPMNCPGHIQLFNSSLRSYRDLPLRYGEFGQCHRNEPSGSLHGMMRVRAFTQDDGHIFCTEDQILKECEDYTRLVQQVYKDFGFTEIAYKVATRPEMRIGEDAAWDKAEAALMKSLDDIGVKYDILEGEGAFYGPKIEYHLKDCLGRSWQCGTIQVDFQMPGRLGAEYVAEDNTRKVPVMLHRAMLGSLERWIGMLIEEYAGAFPVWLAPVQVAVASITDAQSDYVKEVAQKLHEANIRVETDLRNEKINYKIRELSLQKIPFIAVVGDKEKQAGAVAVRARGGKDLGVMSLDDFIAMVRAENDSRAPFAH